MPKVISYTPSWLSKPAAGYNLFVTTEEKGAKAPATSFKALSESIKRNAKPGPRRLIAHRGTEVFVAAGKEIRWADLVYLKENWEEDQARKGNGHREHRNDGGDAGSEDGGSAQGYRVSERSLEFSYDLC
jgi:nucleoporin NUP82